MKASAKIICIGVCFLALLLSPQIHSAPVFHTARWANGTEVDNNEIGDRIPLILVHGVRENASVWNSFLTYFDTAATLKDYFKPYVFEYETLEANMGVSDPQNIPGLGQALGNYLNQWYASPTAAPTYGFNSKPVTILAHSMGGLVSRSMMTYYLFGPGVPGSDKVSLLITLATPHHGTPLANQYIALYAGARYLLGLHPGFAYNMYWDCYDGTHFVGDCGLGIPSSGYYSKIVAYGGQLTPPGPDSYLNDGHWLLCQDGYCSSDGAVPIESALFYSLDGSTAPVRVRYVDGSCDHNEIYNGLKTVDTGFPIFSSIRADLLTLITVSLPPAIFEVSPSALTGRPLPQTQLIRIIGSRFTGSSTLTFNDGVNPPYTGRVPTFISANELDYNITVGPNTATWTVKVVNGAQESNVRTFTVVAQPPPETGSLTVTLQPTAAISAGAQWRVDSGIWNNSGDVVTGLAPGLHSVSCQTATGYTTPAIKSVSITGGAVTSDTETYTVTPPTAYALTLNQGGGQGYILNSPSGSWNGSAYVYAADSTVQLTANANFGYHFVGWGGNLSGTANPANIVMNGNKSVTANFATGDDRLGTVVVTIQPPEAAAAGVQWGLNDTDYRNSDTSYTTFPGSFYIVIHPVNGWWASGYYVVTITAGQTTNYSFAVSSTTGSTVGTDPSTYYTFAGLAGNSGSTDGIGNTARFYNPWSPVTDSMGNLYVADVWNHVVRKITPTGLVTTLAGKAGNAGSTDAVVGTDARFNNPFGIAIDPSNNIYVADTANSTIRKITPSGAVSTLAGSAGNPGSADGTGSVARFYFPSGMVTDTNGNVYVADSSNETIRKITPGGVVTTFAGSANSFGTADGTGSAARFNWPSGLTKDSAGNIYVADSQNATIRKITPLAVVTTQAGFPGSAGAADGTGNAARFSNPNGVVADGAGNVYVADTQNATIRKVTPGGVVTTLAGLSGNTGSADGTGNAVRFNNPTGVALDSAGNLFVTDAANNSIRTTRPPLPKLSLNLLSNQAMISWPTSSVGFILESSISLTGTNWTPVFPIPASVGAMNFVTNAISGNARFYRLRK